MSFQKCPYKTAIWHKNGKNIGGTSIDFIPTIQCDFKDLPHVQMFVRSP